MKKEEKDLNKIQNHLYSRQIGTYGIETMKKLQSLKILIIGLRGNGIEVAKNIVLSGVKKVSIYDTNLVSVNDLGSNFYLEEKDINQRRDESVLQKLIELNPYTEIEIFNKLNKEKDLIESLLNEKEKFDVIVQTELLSENEIFKLSTFCHEKNIIFIYGAVLGLNGFIFSDFGKHTILDKDGFVNTKYHIKNITNEKNAILTVEEKNINIKKNDFILIKYVEGMSEINEMKNIKVLSKNNGNSLELDLDTINFGKYIQGGNVCKIKQPIIKNYKSYQDIINIPFNRKSKEEYISYDESEEIQLYSTKFYLSVYLALGKYLNNSTNYLPKLNDINESNIILEDAKNLFDKMKNHDKEVGLNFDEYSEDEIQKFDEKKAINIISLSRAEISPMCSLIGGYISQEIIKSTGKYEPINQWKIFDLSFVIDNNKKINESQNINNSRYEELISIFGEETQKKIFNTSLFIVGAGAIGCEVLKNFALMGISTNENKYSYLTDCDKIEISNLNRQFLFRQKDIGKSKSLTAFESIKKMNNNFNCNTFEYKVSKETENIFNRKFWDKIDYVILAVDNIYARDYLNNECHKNSKTFIDSGTNGTAGRVEVVIPYVTEQLKISYKNENKQNSHSCTTKYFPTSINDCIDWAKEIFEDLFCKEVKVMKDFANDTEVFIKKLEEIPSNVVIEKCEIIEKFMKIYECENNKERAVKIIENSLEYFNEYYNKRIIELLKNHPENEIDKNGQPFWNAIKRRPKPIPKININESMVKLFIESFYNILTNCLGIPKIELTIDILSDIIKNYIFIDKKEEIDDENQLIQNKKNNLETYKNTITENYDLFKNINEEIFEKDSLDNYHIEFIQSASNLRAQNYYIEQIDRNKTLMIAGNVIQAVPTSTSSVAGYLSLQLISLINNGNNIDTNIKNAHLNLSDNFFAVNSPNKYIPPKVENEINESMTTLELIDYMKNEFNFDINFFDINNKEYFRKRKFKESEKVKEVFKKYKDKIQAKIEDYYNKDLPENNRKNEFVIDIYGHKIDDKKEMLIKTIKYKPIKKS